MSKTSDKLAAGVRKVKQQSAAPVPQPTQQSVHTTAAPSAAASDDPAYGLPATTHGLHPARIWPD